MPRPLALARAIAERAGADGLRAVWADAAGRVGAYQPPSSRAARRRPASAATAAAPETVDGAARLARPAGPARGARTGVAYDDLWRTWVARDDGPAAARRPARRTDRVRRGRRGGRGLAAAAGAPRRDAGVAVRRRRRTLLGDADDGPRRAGPDRDRRGGGRADRPGHAAGGVREPGRVRDAPRSRPPPSSRRSTATRPPSRRDPDAPPTSSRRSVCGAPTPKATSPGPGPCSRRATWPVAAGRRGGRSRPGRGAAEAGRARLTSIGILALAASCSAWSSCGGASAVAPVPASCERSRSAQP